MAIAIPYPYSTRGKVLDGMQKKNQAAMSGAIKDPPAASQITRITLKYGG